MNEILYRVIHIAPHWLLNGVTEYASKTMSLAEATAKMQEMAQKNSDLKVWIKLEE